MPALARTHNAPEGGYPHGTPGYRRTLTALAFGGLANFALLYYVQPLLPALAERYGIGPAQSALALSISTLSLALGLLLVGPLADRYGRLPVMRWSLLSSGVLGLLSAFAPTWEVLMVLRAADGIALAGLPAVALAYLREEVREADHVRANAAYITGTAVGGALGRLLPGPLALAGGWTLATATMGLLTLVAAAVIWTMLPPSSQARMGRVSLRRQVLGTVTAPRDLVVAAVCIAGFALMGVFVGIYNAIAFRLETPPFALGDAVIFVYLSYLAGIPAPLLMSALSRRTGRGPATFVGVGLLGVGVAILSIPWLPAVLIGLSVLTFGFLGTHSLLSGWVVDRAHRRGSSTASAASAYLLGYYLGSAAIGVLAVSQWQHLGWSGVVWLSAALCTIAMVSVVVGWASDRRLPMTVARGR